MTTIDTSTRGRLRLWKAQLAERYARFDKVFTSPTLTNDIEAFCRKSGTGRSRAFTRIAKALEITGAVLEGVRMDGPYPLAVWAILKARVAVAVGPRDPSEAQDCGSVD
jgi:hypothetical protein